MKNVLIISGHTDLNDSVANRIIIEDLRKALPEAEFSVLSEEYPDFEIDVKAEQDKLVKADVIVWQFPVYWYSYPSLLHRWIEDVVVHGFAYGSTGHAIAGKKFIPSFTAGAPAEAYSREAMGMTVEDMMNPQLRGFAALTQLDLRPYVYTCGVSYALRTEAEQLEHIKSLAHDHARRLIEAISQA